MAKQYKELALRDRAYAALMGGMDSNFGVEAASFGGFSGFSGDYSPFGGDAGTAAVAATQQPGHPLYAPHPAAQAIIAEHVKGQAIADQRKKLIDPNMGSDTKIQRYVLSVRAPSGAGILGSYAASNFNVQKNPTTHFHPEKLQTNIPQPYFVMVSRGEVANVAFTVGDTTDAFTWNASALENEMALAPLTPANVAVIIGYFTGVPWAAFQQYTGNFDAVFTFTGHATVAG